MSDDGLKLDDRLKIARREAWRSFMHKLGIVAVALLAYAGLVSLGHAKHEYTKHEKEKWQLTRNTLGRLAKYAKAIAPADSFPTIVVVGGVGQPPIFSDTELLNDIAEHFQGGDRDVKKSIDTKQELVAAAEQIVDARIWRDCTLRISRLTAQVSFAASESGVAASTTGETQATGKVDDARKASETRPTTPEIEPYLDRIAGEESLARTRIAGTHALIEASATQIEQAQKDTPPPLKAMFDEKHPLYVLYEICWYMLLALAVLATSWLLVTIFTVLPFTDAEGYWTKRIGSLLENFGSGVASAALPIASAALVAVTVFAGTGFATTPGGYARSVTNARTTIDDHSTYTRIEPVPPEVPPPSQDYEAALKALQGVIAGQITASEKVVHSAVTESQVVLDKHLDNADLRQVDTLTVARSAETHSGNAESNAASAALHAEHAERQTVSVQAIDSRTDAMAKTIGTNPLPARPLVDQVGTVESSLASSGQRIGEAKSDIDAEYAEESQERNASLAQAATVDPRGFFPRAFGRTLFEVTPAVVHEMAAYLGVRLNAKGKPELHDLKDTKEKENAALIAVLIQASLAGPMHAMYSGEFRKELVRLARTADLSGLAKPEDVQEQLRTYDRQLLHLCALPRY